MVAIFNLPNYSEFLIVAVVGLFLFGKRLPDVARSIGRSVVEFKKGLKDVKDEIQQPPATGSPNTIEPTKQQALPNVTPTGTVMNTGAAPTGSATTGTATTKPATTEPPTTDPAPAAAGTTGPATTGSAPTESKPAESGN